MKNLKTIVVVLMFISLFVLFSAWIGFIWSEEKELEMIYQKTAITSFITLIFEYVLMLLISNKEK